MQSIRLLLRDHLAPVSVLLALTVMLRLLVPAGYMPSITAAGVAIIVCDGAAPGMSHAMPDHHGGKSTPTKPDQPCAFAALSAPSLGGADPIQLAIALAAIIALGLSLLRPLPTLLAVRDRPPLRGPPVAA